MLPELTISELSQLTALISVRSATTTHVVSKTPGSSKGKAGKPSKPSKSAKKKDKVKPSPKVSEYQDIPEYREFKASEKALHSYLKGQKGDERLLSHWVNRQSELLRLSETEKFDLMASIPLVVAGFIEARNCWFRTKDIFTSEKPTPGFESSKGNDSQKGEENATEGTSEADSNA